MSLNTLSPAETDRRGLRATYTATRQALRNLAWDSFGSHRVSVSQCNCSPQPQQHRLHPTASAAQAAPRSLSGTGCSPQPQWHRLLTAVSAAQAAPCSLSGTGCSPASAAQAAPHSLRGTGCLPQSQRLSLVLPGVPAGWRPLPAVWPPASPCCLPVRPPPRPLLPEPPLPSEERRKKVVTAVSLRCQSCSALTAL